MKILVTGANGYLGQGITKTLLDFGHTVIAADYNVSMVDSRAILYPCDLFSLTNPYQYFGQPDIVLHLAWRDGFVHYSSVHIQDLPMHMKFLQTMIQAGIQKIAVMGSMHEVGFYEGSIDENTPCHPQSFYGIAKNALRDVTQILTEQNHINFQWLRGYYIVSNSCYGSSIFSKISAAVHDGKTEFPFTTGQNQFDFLDYSEFCKRVAMTVEQDEITGIINICSGRPEKLADRVERFIAENNYKINLDYGKYPDRPYDSKAVWGDCNKIEQIIKNRR